MGHVSTFSYDYTFIWSVSHYLWRIFIIFSCLIKSSLMSNQEEMLFYKEFAHKFLDSSLWNLQVFCHPICSLGTDSCKCRHIWKFWWQTHWSFTWSQLLSHWLEVFNMLMLPGQRFEESLTCFWLVTQVKL